MQAAVATSNHSDLRERVLAYLDQRTVFNLATSGPAGLWASAVLYVNDGLTLYFTSVAATRHGQNMLASPLVVGTISDECREFVQMKGLQIEGKVEHVDEPAELRRVVRAYLQRFPFAAGLWNGESNPEVIARNPGIHGFYRIIPTRVLFTDNEHSPGAREELSPES
jgi:uncharacterized protein YhbP (UPF0306 family)